ncbi:Aerotaxis receptor [Shewanella sp. P1-14-1]|nr:Aerotaxis receptor [Shewanella sp. P1-14-1]
MPLYFLVWLFPMSDIKANNIEQPLTDECILLSTTDLYGNIKYANQAFADISEFTTDELHGKPHNIVRHPDMPKAAFESLWQRVKDGKPWFGIVKNKSKTGKYYWVNAYISPVFENGKMHELQSVRRKPCREHINSAEKIYKQLNQGKAPRETTAPLLSFTGSLCLWAIVISLIGVVSSLFMPTLVAAFFIPLMAGFVMYYITRPLKELENKATKIIDDPIACGIFSSSQHELGKIELALNYLVTEMGGVVGRMADSATSISEESLQLNQTISTTRERVKEQTHQTRQAATAMEQMTARFTEVNQNIRNTAQEITTSQEAASKGHDSMDKVVNAIGELRKEVVHFSTVVNTIEKDSQSIASVLGEIKGIAEQTNLLALNAAIEAARAGETGRGFAVVADEVRQLSIRTSDSTSEIEHIVTNFQKTTKEATQAMESGQLQADLSVSLAEEADDTFAQLLNSINRIHEMAELNSSAMNQQTAVAEEISQSILQIDEISNLTLIQTDDTQNKCEQMSRLANKTRHLSRQFWTQTIERTK